MSLRQTALYAAAGLAGWFGVAWWQPAHRSDRTARSAPSHPSSPSYSSQNPAPLRPPAPGSAGLAAVPALIAAIPNDGLAAATEAIQKWPPGTAREFALELLKGRQAAAEDPFYDPDAPPEESGDPPYNRFRELAATIQQGDIMAGGGLHSGTFHDLVTLKEWVRMDPAAATAAILKMPPAGSRSAAVDLAVETLANGDPAAALDFYFKSGDKNLGGGTAEAWKKLVLAEQDPAGAPDLQRQFLDRMSRAQHDRLFEELADSIQSRDVSDPLPDSELNLLARCVLQTGEVTPGLESFFEKLSDHPQTADQVRQFIESCSQLSPAHEKALEILWAKNVESIAESGLDPAGFIRGDDFDSHSIRADHQALLDRAAPSIVTKYADTGRLPEALQLLDRIHDPDAQRASLEALLPHWLEADPAVARAAFDAAPLTALERERWEQRLLNAPGLRAP